MKRKRILWGVAIAVAVLWVSWFAWERHWYRGSIPPQIRTAGAVRISGETHFLSGCGVAIFRLSNETRDAIRSQGLAFLASGRTAKRHSYDPWQETPVRGEMLGGTGCANLSRSLQVALDESIRKPGSYFTTDGQSTLLVIPDAMLVVFSYLD